ncbi:MAG: short-chain dehydrogenase [Comamonas sp. SCN 65-56]|uniref:SDR family NAD(P)-dependent oxidoreductase n=1 Tax=Comamonas sp. SCN 65-56 TaxID=1660095 RepID=UPI00086967E4|nr:SDR family NAD(P)-dependent oxidoreductase [Comamonas sp. SCN 65-56]ODS90836.1 MAG: short-chain dehydrogenase [Comamonas sp. SCN 65-56]
MNPPQRIVVIGATSAIAHQCGRLWAQQGPCDFLLVGRDAQRAASLAADLCTRGASVTARTAELRFDDVGAIAVLARDAVAAGPVDIVLIAHGSLPDQSACQDDLYAVQDALRVNALSPALIAEAFIGPMQQARHGRLCLIGSVAGDRGRKSNYIYGAAKGLVDRYAQGLQHRLALAGSPVRVTLAKPGPTDTPMTAHLKQSGARLASAEAVARSIVKAIATGQPVVYAPGKWALIMLVIRHLPRFVFNKLDI